MLQKVYPYPYQNWLKLKLVQYKGFVLGSLGTFSLILGVMNKFYCRKFGNFLLSNLSQSILGVLHLFFVILSIKSNPKHLRVVLRICIIQAGRPRGCWLCQAPYLVPKMYFFVYEIFQKWISTRLKGYSLKCEQRL